MLIDFSFSNYRNFRDEQSFSMTREARFVEDGQRDLSTVTAVYGANASGKSNFLKALWHMCCMVRDSYSQGGAATGVDRDPFLLTADPAASDSMYYAEFMGDDGQRYRYWFRFDDNAILEEDLVVYKALGDRLSTHPSRLFSRTDTDIEFGPLFRGPRAQVKKTIELRPNALVLSAAAAAGIECIQSAFDFFASDVTLCEASGFEDEQPLIVRELTRDTRFAQHLASLIRYADFGISDIQSAPVNVPEEILDTLRRQFREQLGVTEDKIEQFLGPQRQVQLQFEHTGDGTTAMLGMHHESRGTLAALSFFSLALRRLSRRSVTLIDEIDMSLHPSFVRELVSLFADEETNPHHSQLMFTTHDTSLITESGSGERLISPDQVWLVQKSGDGASEIYPVTDLGVRKEENIGKNYLHGVYGATPKPSFHAAFARIINEGTRN